MPSAKLTTGRYGVGGQPHRILVSPTVLDPLLGHAVELDGERDEQTGEQLGKPELAGHSSRLYRPTILADRSAGGSGDLRSFGGNLRRSSS
jgi:hypothetical protein